MQWLSAAFLLLVMIVLRRLVRGAAPVEANATLALGFLIIAAYLGGEIARRFKLPRITGYLLSGLVVGPAGLTLVRGEEVEALSVLSTGALAFVAFAAGNQLRFARLREHLAVTLRIAGCVMAVPFAAVTLVVLSVSPWFPLTAHQPFRDAVVIALVLGAVAAVSSPIITWVMIRENRAHRGFAATIYRVTVLQDAAGVLLLVVLLALAQPLASGGAVKPGIALDALTNLVGSIAAGALLGLAIGEYARVIRGRTTLVLIVAAFLVVQAVRLLGLEPALIGLAAGCALANTTQVDREHMRSTLERCELAVYVVFFVLAGAGMQLGALSALWPWALLLGGLRVTGFWGGSQWAGRLRSVRQDAAGSSVVDYGWLGLVSQGGLVLSLAAVLRRAFPEWGITLESLIVATVGVHMIAGPLTFQWAMQRAGAVGEGMHDPESVGSVEPERTGPLVSGSSGL